MYIILTVRFRTVVLLSALAIAPVCAKRIKVSNERRIVDSMLSVDGVGCSGGGLHSSGAGGSRGVARGGRGNEGRGGGSGGVVGSWWRGEQRRRTSTRGEEPQVVVAVPLHAAHRRRTPKP